MTQFVKAGRSMFSTEKVAEESHDSSTHA
jgi:hypothetical protein